MSQTSLFHSYQHRRKYAYLCWYSFCWYCKTKFWLKNGGAYFTLQSTVLHLSREAKARIQIRSLKPNQVEMLLIACFLWLAQLPFFFKLIFDSNRITWLSSLYFLPVPFSIFPTLSEFHPQTLKLIASFPFLIIVTYICMYVYAQIYNYYLMGPVLFFTYI